MLKQLRQKKTAKWIWIILAIIIVPAFVLWGFGGALRSQKEGSYAGRIFGKRVSALELKDSMDAVKNQAIIQFGDNFDEIQKYLNLEAQAWERLILLYEAGRQRIKVSDAEVIERIESYPFFQRRGQFDNKIYAEMLQYAFHTQPRMFEEQARQNLMISNLYQQVTQNLALSDEEIKKEYQKANEEISIHYIASLPAELAKQITVLEPEIKDYFDKNSFEFKQPISYNIEYVCVLSKQAIRDALKRLRKKEDFKKVAKDLGGEAKETGLFTQTDSIPGIGWSPQVLNIISKLKAGQLSAPINLDKNYYVLRLKEKREPYIPDFGGIKEKVKEALIKKKSQDLARQKIDDCLKILKESAKTLPAQPDFGRLAAQTGLKAGATDLFKYGSYIEGIGASDNFWVVAQGLKDAGFSGIIEMPGGSYIIKLKLRMPIDEKKFAQEKNEFSRKALELKKQEYFAKFVEELKNKN